jgi:hypothetical protein
MKSLSLKRCISTLILVLTWLLSAACAEDDYPGAVQRDQGQ